MNNLKNFSLLYVEDEPQTLELIKNIFSDKVSVLYTAVDGEEGLKIFKEKRPDIVISDIHMPKMNGLELSEKIKKISPDTPILLLTALDKLSFLHESIQLGIDAYIMKPIINRETLEGPLQKVAAQLISAEIEKKSFEKIQKIIDLQKNIVFVTDGKKTDFVNQSFLDFFSITNINQFKKDHNCMCSLFLSNDKYFHLGKIQDKDSWLEVLSNLEEEKKLVELSDTFNNKHVFQVAINDFEESQKIVVLSDISSTIKETIRYKMLSEHDTLTGIFNREYLDANFSRYLVSATREHKKIAVILFDIDHFKKVNDTYGHYVGDEVLIEVTQLVKNSIRIHDVLVRWGGEEFIILVEVSTMDEAVSIAEYLRVSIENYSFKTIETLTCSFGLSMCSENSKLKECVNRSDINLYKAKSDGRNRVCF